MNRTLWHAGVIFVALGMMFAVVPTGSYSTIAGERTVGVSVAADDSALIALEDRTTTVNSSRWTAIAALVNNLDSAADVTYVVALDTNAVQLRGKENQSVTTNLTSGSANEFEAKCGRVQTATSGTATLSVTVDAQATNATVSSATLTTTISFDCAPGGGAGTGSGGTGGGSGTGPPNGTGGGPPAGTGTPA